MKCMKLILLISGQKPEQLVPSAPDPVQVTSVSSDSSESTRLSLTLIVILGLMCFICDTSL